MEKAIKTTSQLGFVLRDLKNELLARLTDELLLNDKNAKAIASTKCLTRASKNAHIGEGNMNFFMYSILGRIYLLLQVLIEGAKKLVLHASCTSVNYRFEEVLYQPSFCTQVNCFSKKKIIAQTR